MEDALRTWEEGAAWKTDLDVENIYFTTYGLKGYHYQLAFLNWRSRKGQKCPFSNGPLRRENSSTHIRTHVMMLDLDSSLQEVLLCINKIADSFGQLGEKYEGRDHFKKKKSRKGETWNRKDFPTTLGLAEQFHELWTPRFLMIKHVHRRGNQILFNTWPTPRHQNLTS